jgi:acyl-coenzyme A synthetase/AMP-(fatty) acid ligase
MLLPFLNITASDAPALIDDGASAWCSYGQLEASAENWSKILTGPKSLVLFSIENKVDHVSCLLGALGAGHSVALIDPSISEERMAALKLAYEPDFVICSDASGALQLQGQANQRSDIHADNSVLLSTSGSTGSPKFVRLSLQNLISNAQAIANVLDIRPEESGSGHLQLHYSFGLSVLTSHLTAGASVVLTDRSFTDSQFWKVFRERPISHLPGVPFHHEMMLKLGLQRLPLSSVRVLTQAGGFLNVEARTSLWQFMEDRGGRFHVMYGQTEAAPRITTLEHDQFTSAPNSVGTALEGGKIQILDEAGQLCSLGVSGLVCYRGPNVMLGYATCRDDLKSGDMQGGTLETGDIGYLDSEERLILTGRAKRFGKAYGLRIGLDEVERLLAPIGKFVALQRTENTLDLIAESEPSDTLVKQARACLTTNFNIPASVYRFHFTEQLYYTARGKIDYGVVEAML